MGFWLVLQVKGTIKLYGSHLFDNVSKKQRRHRYFCFLLKVQMPAQALIFKQMQMSFLQMYRRRARDRGAGPVSTFQHTDLLAKCASTDPLDAQWLTFPQSSGVVML